MQPRFSLLNGQKSEPSSPTGERVFFIHLSTGGTRLNIEAAKIQEGG